MKRNELPEHSVREREGERERKSVRARARESLKTPNYDRKLAVNITGTQQHLTVADNFIKILKIL